MLAGELGADSSVLVNFNANLEPLPHPEEYASLTLSPVIAAALLRNLTLSVCDVNEPESTSAVEPNVPTNDHAHPVADPVKAGAVYR